jgi:hypothetical protein
MQKKEDKLLRLKVESINLPLAFKTIYFQEIPSEETEKKCSIYNDKYCLSSSMQMRSPKPITKIV